MAQFIAEYTNEALEQYHNLDANNHDWVDVKTRIKDAMTRFLAAKTGRKPMILPVIMDV